MILALNIYKLQIRNGSAGHWEMGATSPAVLAAEILACPGEVGMQRLPGMDLPSRLFGVGFPRFSNPVLCVVILETEVNIFHAGLTGGD